MMKTIKDAEKRGAKIYREVHYFAELNGMIYALYPEAHYEYKYSWRKFPKRRKKS